MTWALRLLAIVNVPASILCFGLSSMASDDVSRSSQAHLVQGLQLVWIVASVVTPILAASIARRDVAASHRAYIPMVVISIVAFAALIRF